MHPELRQILARLRVGLGRPGQLEAAVDGACARLVTARFDGERGVQEISPYVRPFLRRFEDEIARASLWALEGEHYRAVRAVESADRALADARRMARAHEGWEECSRSWWELHEAVGLAAFPDAVTVRMAESSLRLAEEMLGTGESRKARFVVSGCRRLVRQLAASNFADDRLPRLIDRRSNLRTSGTLPAALDRLLARLLDEGRVELADRLLGDWEIAGDAGSFAPSAFSIPPDRTLPRVGAERRMARLRAQEREARSLTETLIALHPAESGAEDSTTEEGGEQCRT